LEPHLHSLPNQPDLIPYKTSYYKRTWGLCLADIVKKSFPREGLYTVDIDTTLNEKGYLTYGEWFLPGETEEEVFFSTHICHPQLAIDNLSSVAVLAELGKRLSTGPKRKLGIRIVLVPGTIGPLVWLSRNLQYRKHAPAFAFVLALAGAAGPLHLKHPGPGKQTNMLMAQQVGTATNRPVINLPYEPYGYDERQYNTLGPAFGAVRIGRANYNGYPEYHTSADNMALLSDRGLLDTLAYLEDLVEACQKTKRYTSTVRAGEPQYSRHGAFEMLPGLWPAKREREQALYWLMSHANNSLLQEIATESGLPLPLLEAVAGMLVQKSLLRVV
jgi:aminopeptidase-like protein